MFIPVHVALVDRLLKKIGCQLRLRWLAEEEEVRRASLIGVTPPATLHNARARM